MLTPMNIAAVAGVLILLLLLLKLRRGRARPDGSAAAEGRRRRSERRAGARGRRTGPPAEIEAAVGEVSATATPEASARAPMVPEGPAREAAPAAAGGAGAAEDRLPASPAAGGPTLPDAARAADPWSRDEVIDAPGWPAPGEMDGGWSAPTASEPGMLASSGPLPDPDEPRRSAPPAAGAGDARPGRWDEADGAAEFDSAAGWTRPGDGRGPGAGAGEALGRQSERAASEPDAVPPEPAGEAPPDPVAEEAADWGAEWAAPEAMPAPGPEDAPEWRAGWAAPELGESAAGSEAEPATEPEPATEAEPVTEAQPELELGDAPGWEVEWPAVEPAGEAPPEPVAEEAADWGAEWAAPEAMPAPGPEDAPEWGAGWAAPEPGGFAAGEPTEARRSVPPDDALGWVAEPPAAVPAGPPDGVEPITAIAAAPQAEAEDEGPLTGRFALGGFAPTAGHQVVTGVTFRFAPERAPAGWVLGPRDDAPPGTIVIEPEATLNCSPSDLEVVQEPGLAPTRDGFSVRLRARDPGPFAAAGSFRLMP
jgi:hypothetical protein